MTKPIIDKATGQLRLANNFIVTTTTTPKRLIDYFGQTSVEVRDMLTGWKHYTIRNLKLNDKYYMFTFFFENNVLKWVSFIVDESYISGTWADWSEQKELQKQVEYNNWLTNEVGEERQFFWGTVASFYDDKSGGVSICLKYAFI